VRDAPVFQLIGSFRCCASRESGLVTPCGRIAGWMSRPDVRGMRLYFCHQHLRPLLEPIAGEQLVRRVSVTAEILFCGTSNAFAIAEADALAALERAVAQAGGIINLHNVRSNIGYYTPQAFGGAAQGAGNRGQ
jgi:hypothetical protein